MPRSAHGRFILRAPSGAGAQPHVDSARHFVACLADLAHGDYVSDCRLRTKEGAGGVRAGEADVAVAADDCPPAQAHRLIVYQASAAVVGLLPRRRFSLPRRRGPASTICTEDFTEPARRVAFDDLRILLYHFSPGLGRRQRCRLTGGDEIYHGVSSSHVTEYHAAHAGAFRLLGRGDYYVYA